jgi:hypothetical protein
MMVYKISGVIVDVLCCIVGVILMTLIAVLGTIGFTCLKIVEVLQKHTRKFMRLRLL